MSIFLGKEPAKKNEQVTLMENVLGAFRSLRKACSEAPVLAFADFNKTFLLETEASKLGMGTVYECYYDSTKEEFQH